MPQVLTNEHIVHPQWASRFDYVKSKRIASMPKTLLWSDCKVGVKFIAQRYQRMQGGLLQRERPHGHSNVNAWLTEKTRHAGCTNMLNALDDSSIRHLAK